MSKMDDTSIKKMDDMASKHTPNTSTLQVMLLNDDAMFPVRINENDAGYDLYAAESVIITSKVYTGVKTGVAVALPSGTYGRIAPRSGNTLKFGLDVGAGVIDAGYRGELVIALSCRGDDHHVKKGDKIAQMIVTKIETPEIAVVKTLDKTDRGDAGFGSTGF